MAVYIYSNRLIIWQSVVHIVACFCTQVSLVSERITSIIFVMLHAFFLLNLMGVDNCSHFTVRTANKPEKNSRCQMS